MEDDFKNKGAVAFIDILGFKGIWQRRNPKEVLYILNKVPETIINSYEHPPQNWPETSPPQVVILSDTIVITIDTKETTPESEKPSCLLILGNILTVLFVTFIKVIFLLEEQLATVNIFNQKTHS